MNYAFICNQFLILFRDCFVTGKWKESEDAEELLKMDDEDDDVYGDFEDLETGEVSAHLESSKKRSQKIIIRQFFFYFCNRIHMS